MAKGSQLTQLKTALSQAGLDRKAPAGKKRKRTQQTSRELDNEKRLQKLENIKQKLNPFDVKVTKLKHDVGGRKPKGVTGKPQQSKQAGLDLRTVSLQRDYEKKTRAGGILDRRIGESDPTMTPEERMLERFTKERQRTSKVAAFNLADEDELTHYGQSLSNLDDFDGVGVGFPDDDEDEDGKIDQHTVKHAHFGGFDEEDEEEDGPPRKKTKAEVMAEVMAKSKLHKQERQIEREKNDETRHQLDEELNEIRGLLFAEANDKEVADALEKDDKDYDVQVRELAMDKRAKPKDRTKTEEELALEAKAALENAERKRLKRMNGEEDDGSDDGTGPPKRRRREVGGDDLDDDFGQEDVDWDGLGEGLGGQVHDDGEGPVDGKVDSSSEGGDDSEEDGVGDSTDSGDGDSGDETPTKSIRTRKKYSDPSSSKELPFTFACPETCDEFLSIVEDVPVEEVPVVVQRIRTLYHPSLGEGNKSKLQTLTGVLLDYILHITSLPEARFSFVPPLIPHILALTRSYPIESAKHFISKLKLMHKNLTRGLSHGALSPTSKTWPGACELTFLWTISHVWPTSDKSHPVISPVRLLMGSYLGLCRVRSLPDVASGLFLCTLVYQFEESSKRFVPEVLNCLLNTVLHLSPHRFKNDESIPGDFPCPDLDSDLCKPLRLSKHAMKQFDPKPPRLIAILTGSSMETDQDRVDLLGTTFDLLGRFAGMYKSLDGSIELLRPVIDVLEGLKLDSATDALQAKLSGCADAVTRLVKFAREARQPLQLQQHKPIPIATYVPKFENSTSNYLRKFDPDYERNEASKLRYQYKEERKGAIRELRKDAQFLAGIKHKEQMEKDKEYKDRMNRVFNTLEGERAEQKKIDREKLKEKKRSGRK